MCGIAGVFYCRNDLPPPDARILVRMAEKMAHRGPDDQGVQVGAYWALASRRLAVIGVQDGRQPLADEQAGVWTAFNGEIYNYRELRETLRTAGHAFRTHADTEVLVHMYQEEADGMVGKLEGMYAFALVDVLKRRLLLVRDRMGQKPLFYHVDPSGSVIFASELPSLLAYPGIPTEPDTAAIRDFLSLGYIPAPRTIYSQIFKLPPGSMVAFGQNRRENRLAQPARYWKPQLEPKIDISRQEAVSRTRTLIGEAVAKRLEAEVPLGAFLSGGLDSSAVVAMMQKQMSSPPKTFSIGFDQQQYDERRYASAVAHHLGTDHAEKIVQPGNLDLLQRIIGNCGEPFADSSILPTALLSQFAREHVTVALSGDGGDELFGGYRRYRAMLIQKYLQAVPPAWRKVFCRMVLKALPREYAPKTKLSMLRRILNVVSQNDEYAYATFQQVFSPEAIEQICSDSTASRGAASSVLEPWQEVLRKGTARDFVERFMELDLLTYLPEDLLFKVDIASMMFSLEVRSPFLDHRLVEFVNSLPRSLKVSLHRRKYLLGKAAGELLPAQILKRGKMGFGVPLSQWFRGSLGKAVNGMTDTDRWDEYGVLSQKAVKRIWEEHLSGKADHGSRLWALLCLKMWYEYN